MENYLEEARNKTMRKALARYKELIGGGKSISVATAQTAGEFGVSAQTVINWRRKGAAL